jgi:hypothetical protein
VRSARGLWRRRPSLLAVRTRAAPVVGGQEVPDLERKYISAASVDQSNVRRGARTHQRVSKVVPHSLAFASRTTPAALSGCSRFVAAVMSPGSHKDFARAACPWCRRRIRPPWRSRPADSGSDHHKHAHSIAIQPPADSQRRLILRGLGFGLRPNHAQTTRNQPSCAPIAARATRSASRRKRDRGGERL